MVFLTITCVPENGIITTDLKGGILQWKRKMA